MRKKTLERLVAQLKAEAAALQAKVDYDHYADASAASKKQYECMNRMIEARTQATVAKHHAEAEQWRLKYEAALRKAKSQAKNCFQWLEEIVALESDASRLQNAMSFQVR